MAVKDWFYISKLSGSSGTTILTISASSNTLLEELSSVFSVSTTNNNKNVFVKQEPLERDYFTIEVISGNANSHLYLSYTNEVIYSYSKNGGDWITHTSGSTGQTDFSLLNNGDIIKVKALNMHNNYDRNNKMRQIRFSSANCKFKVKGYLTSLVYGDSFENQTVLPNEIYSGTSGAFQYLFRNCTGLVDASELILPDTLLIRMYYSTFRGCTSLTTAPSVLPATTLANGCYYYMFEGCTSLTTAPELPATTLADRCYFGMFNNCKSLTTAPELPATTLADRCYLGMFNGCTSLTTAPELPATTVPPYCYSYMFNGCSSLNYIKCLATDISAAGCTESWVSGVAATGTFIRAAGMNDWGIDSINGIPIGWTNKYVEQYLTFDIISAGTITWIKSNIFASDRTIEYSKDNGSTWNSITSSRNGVSFSVNSGEKISFRGNNAHFATSNINYTYFQTTCKFKVNGNIMSLLNSNNFASQNTLQSGSTFCCLFINNTGLTDAEFLELPATTIKDSCYEGMFSGCTSLEKAPAKLPATTLEYECYENMFGGCTSLTTAPILPALSLSTSCYSGMFDGCTSLNYIRALFTTTPSTTYTSNWVRNVASSGTFVKNSSATWTTTGNNGVPTNWTIETV